MKIVYYAHPVETYGTYLEDITRKLVKKRYGRINPIFDFPNLREVINPNMQKELDALFNEMITILRKYENGKISKDKVKATARDISYKLMDTLRSKAHTSLDILFSPSVFSPDIGLAPWWSKRFKRETYPDFCYGFIDHCDDVIAHGYMLNKHIKRIFKDWLRWLVFTENLSREEVEYCKKLRELLDKEKNMLWSPGTLNEIMYASKKGKKIYIVNKVRNEYDLLEVSSREIDKFKDREVPFDRHGQYLYKKIWQPIARSVYDTATTLKISLKNFEQML